MKTLIICQSYHHGNTKKVADAIGEVLDAEVIDPAEASSERLAAYDLIGFGSGIAFGKHYEGLLKCVERLPTVDKKAFIFSTRGAPRQGSHHNALTDLLKSAGFTILGEFSCRGWDTYVPVLKLIGGIARGHPNEQDLRDAREFAARLREGSK
jgi:flavodoxin